MNVQKRPQNAQSWLQQFESPPRQSGVPIKLDSLLSDFIINDMSLPIILHNQCGGSLGALDGNY